MFKLKRLLGIGGLAAMIAAFAFALPAQASNLKAQCVVAGGAKTNPPVQLTGFGGAYNFDSLGFACVGESKGSPVVAVLSVSSSGTYTNIVCGTGKATSQANSLNGPGTVIGSPDVDLAAVVGQLKYVVEFVGTVGVFYWHGSGKLKLPSEIVKPQSLLLGDGGKDDLDPGGVVQLGPPLPNEKEPAVPSPPDCTKAFHVTGTINIDYPGTQLKPLG